MSSSVVHCTSQYGTPVRYAVLLCFSFNQTLDELLVKSADMSSRPTLSCQVDTEVVIEVLVSDSRSSSVTISLQ